jgi:hypothetical protein
MFWKGFGLLFNKKKMQKWNSIHETVDAMQTSIKADLDRVTEYRLNGDYEAAIMLVQSCQERNELCGTLLDEAEAI